MDQFANDRPIIISSDLLSSAIDRRLGWFLWRMIERATSWKNIDENSNSNAFYCWMTRVYLCHNKWFLYNAKGRATIRDFARYQYSQLDFRLSRVLLSPLCLAIVYTISRFFFTHSSFLSAVTSVTYRSHELTIGGTDSKSIVVYSEHLWNIHSGIPERHCSHVATKIAANCPGLLFRATRRRRLNVANTGNPLRRTYLLSATCA